MSSMTKMVIAVLAICAAAAFFFWQGGSDKADVTSGSTRQVVDSMGRTVTIPREVKRVVLLNASSMEIFCEAGGADLIVGKPTTKATPAKWQDKLANVPEVGILHSPNVETILSLKPDLVIGVNVPFHHTLIKTMEGAGIPMVIRSLETYEQVLESLEFFGDIAGTPDVAAAKKAEVEAKYQAVTEKYRGQKPPKTLMIWGSPDSFQMASKKSFVGDLLERLGGNNIADHADGAVGQAGFLPFGMEFVAKEDPEVICLVTHSSDPAIRDKFLAQMNEQAIWSGIKAVKTGRVYALPYELFAVNPGTQIAEAIEVLAQIEFEENGK